ncbi:MAG: TolC family outer membrane protein [Gammaproteobacteria bacterium]|jgi:outer membrane protein|nr:TolC family outer membrane protein [Gammaproteobacteria bacterium]
MITTRITALGLALFLTTAAQGQTLMEIYNQALRSDPALREAEANMQAQMQAKPQAWAALLPQLDLSADWTRDYADGDSNIIDTSPGAPIGATVIRASESDIDTKSWSVNLRQTLFNTEQWFRLKKSGKEVAQAQVDYQAAQQDLMIRVSEAYFNVLAAQDTLVSEQASKEAIGRQLEQAERRFEVGLIAITDVKEAQAAYDDAVALEIEARRALANAKEVLREITGEYPQTLASPGEEFPLIPPDPQVEQDWVDVSLQQNFALESARIGTEISRDNVRIARTGHAPTLDFSASRGNNNRYRGEQDTFDEASGTSATSPRTSDTNSSRVGISLNVPIYSGGGVSSQVQEQVYLHRASRENFEKVARETERETRDAYLGVIAEIARVQALARSEESNMIALEATEAGYEVGTRTAVDVLDARRSLFLAQTQYARAKYDYLINVIKLKEAAGTLAPDDLSELDSWLVTKEELQAIPGRGGQPDASMPDTTVTEPVPPELESAQ